MMSFDQIELRLIKRVAKFFVAAAVIVSALFGVCAGFAHVGASEVSDLPSRVALEQKLNDIDRMINDLKVRANENVQAAVDGQKQCLNQVKDFDQKLGAINQQRSDFDKRGDELKALLARTGEQNRNSSALAEQLRSNVEKSRASLAQLERNFELLRKWWWVPGYGQYLSIKTLVDGEIAQHKTILAELQNSQMQLANQDALMLDARRMLCEIAEERESMNGASEALTCLHNVMQKKGVEYREKTIALLDREAYWSKLNNLGTITVDGRRQALKVLFDAKPSANVEHAIAGQASKLESAIHDYRQKLDEGQQFLTSTPKNFCSHEDSGNTCAVVKASPTSSFQYSCITMKVTGDGSVLSAQCKRRDGSLNNTSIALRGIHNSNGSLVGGAQGGSSFQRSCKDVFVCGSTIMASCKMKNGNFVDANIKIDGLHNINGVLTY